MTVDTGLHHLVEGHMVVPLLTFLRNLHADFHSGCPVNSTTSSEGGFHFSTLSLALGTSFFFFYKGHSSRGEVMAPCGFDLHLPYN